MTTKHTPGPYINEGCLVWTLDSKARMDMESFVCEARDEENAAFIVKACNSQAELLEALERLEHAAEHGTIEQQGYAAKIARAAIAKAKGEA